MATLIKRSVRIPSNDLEGPFNFCYALDGSLYVANNLGSVWHVSFAFFSFSVSLKRPIILSVN